MKMTVLVVGILFLLVGIGTALMVWLIKNIRDYIREEEA